MGIWIIQFKTSNEFHFKRVIGNDKDIKEKLFEMVEEKDYSIFLSELKYDEEKKEYSYKNYSATKLHTFSDPDNMWKDCMR